MDWFRDQMKKGMNPRTYLLLGFLIAVLFWIQSLDAKQRAFRAKAAAVTMTPAPAVPAVARLAERTGPRAAQTPVGWGSDPFERRVLDLKGSPGTPVSAHTAPPAPDDLYLQGIMDGPMGRTALINGDIYREGARIGSREVIQIGKKAVMILDKKGAVTTLTLKGDGS
jgi:hypothetical protein